MGSYFDLLDLADGASGEEAVAKVVAKVGTEKKKDPKETKQPAQQPQQLGRGRGQGPVGWRQDDGYQGGRGRGNGQGFYNGNVDRGYYSNNGNGGYYSNSGDRGYYSNSGDRGYYSNSGDRGYYSNNGDHGYYSNNGDRGYYNDNSGYDQVYYENNGQYHQEVYGGEYSYRYGERQAVGGNHYNGDRQGYSRDAGQSRRKNVQYRPKPASDTASDAGHRPEGKVVPAVETKQVATSSGNGDEVPASESEKSAGDAAKDDSKKGEGVSENKEGEGDSVKKEGEGDPEKKKKIRDPNVKRLSGSARRKLKKQNPKDDPNADKQGPNVEGCKKTTDEEPEVMVIEEKKVMTLEEYEKMREEKKSLDSSKSERKISAVAFEGLQLLEKKKVEDDATYKLGNDQEDENGQPKGKEVKARKAISIHEYFQDYVPPRRRGGFSNGNFRGGRFGGDPTGHGNGGFSGRSRDNSSEPRVYNSGHGDNAIVFHNVGDTMHNGGYQDRRDSYNGGYQGRRDGYNNGYNGRVDSGGYNGGRGNGGYQQGGRGNGGYQGRGRRVEVPKPDYASHFPALSGAAPTPAQAQAPAQSPARS